MPLPAFLRPSTSSAISRSTRQSRNPLRVLGGHDREDDTHTDEARIPLTALDPDDSFASDYPPPAPKRTASSPISRLSALLGRTPVRRTLAILVVLVGLYKLHRYTSNNTDYYDRLSSKVDDYSARYNPWHPKPIHISYIPTNTSVRVRGRRYRAAKERIDDRYWGWKAVPYAKGPEGDKRFRVSEWLDEVKEGKEKEMVMDKWDEGCVRPRPRKDGKDGPKDEFDGHEDCLRLNIFSPVQRPNDTLLPVMVWIHGGGFVGGTSAEEKYNPRDLMHRSIELEEEMVFVSINYRLGALGFTASPPAPGDPPMQPHVPIRAPTDLDLNVGFKDQILALRWIKTYIEGFGGDPEKVTLVGHSAGAMSVGLHQLYTDQEGLFRGAFMLSGAPTSFPVPWPHDASARTLHPLPGPAQCPSPIQRDRGPPMNNDLLACLRGLSIDKLYQATRVLTDDYAVNGWFPYYPVLEGEWGTGAGQVNGPRGSGGWLDVRPSVRINRGDYAKIPVVMGAVLDEGTRFVAEDIGEGEGEFLEVIKDIFDFTYGAVEDLLEPILSYYPPTPSSGSPFNTGPEAFGLTSTYKRLSAFVGDILFQAPRRHFLRETPKDFGEDSWNYVFVEKREGAEERMGVQHGADLPSWFNHPEANDPEMAVLSRDMASYLINFVHHLNPNGPGLPHWPQYTMDRLTLQLARAKTAVVTDSDRLEAMRFLNINNPVFAR
ncbi:hypothetical protein JCM11641_005034 [Rhodosporidiobolus odoratus]